ncbi:hypothetical protein BGZ70_005005 [Mortierella alpina]|uniref:Secreted protein n=1 Tax=Mortierella alpina TaxID=64518 RepID=A0A9P6IQ93_MORAP|nr:hypothetical protein BGZ70_005005 [Mortierella alpina]
MLLQNLFITCVIVTFAVAAPAADPSSPVPSLSAVPAGSLINFNKGDQEPSKDFAKEDVPAGAGDVSAPLNMLAGAVDISALLIHLNTLLETVFKSVDSNALLNNIKALTDITNALLATINALPGETGLDALLKCLKSQTGLPVSALGEQPNPNSAGAKLVVA